MNNLSSRKILRSGRGEELFLVALVVYAASVSSIVSIQDGTHFALTWSIATSHSFSLGNGLYAGQQYTTKLGGNVFSSLPPGLSFFGFVFVEMIHSLLPRSSSALVSEYAVAFLSAVIGALTVYFFFLLSRLFAGERISSLLAILFAFGTGMWIYSRVYLPEGLATLLGMVAVYCVLAGLRSPPGERSYPLLLALSSGIALGLMYTVDNMGIFFLPPLIIFLLASRRLYSAGSLIGGFILGAIPFAYYDLSTTGGLFTAPYGLGILGGIPQTAYSLGNLLPGLYELLLSPQSGLLLFSPVVLVSLVATSGPVRARLFAGGSAPLFIALFLFTLIPFALQNPTTYLHNTLGPSELILGVPYLLLLGSGLERLDRMRTRIIAAAILGFFSFMVNGIVTLTTPVVNPLLGGALSDGSPYSFLQANVQLFQIGGFSAWWSQFQQASLFAYFVLAFPVFVLLVYSVDILRNHRKLIVEEEGHENQQATKEEAKAAAFYKQDLAR